MQKTAVTERDYQRLASLASAIKQGPREQEAKRLQARLSDAVVLEESVLAGSHVTMGSTVLLRESDGDDRYEYTLVFPSEADIAQGRISVLTPLGASLLGRRAGEAFEYESPGGPVGMIVERIHRAA